MRVFINLKPIKIRASTRVDILNKITGGIWATNRFTHQYSSKGNFLVREDRSTRQKTVRLYNLEKHNRKVHTTKRLITKGKRKGELDVTTTVIREGGWVAHYYDIPYDMIEKAVQKTRHFTLTLKV